MWWPVSRGSRGEDGKIPERYPLTPLPGAFATGTWQRTQVREASRARAPDSPLSSERSDARTARPDGGYVRTARQVAEQYRARTLKNVQDSDGTVILFSRTLSGGTLLTRNLCVRQKKLLMLVNAAEANAKRMTALRAAGAIVRFVEEHKIYVLNVAGPRASGWSQGYAFALRVVGEVIGRCRRPGT